MPPVNSDNPMSITPGSTGEVNNEVWQDNDVNFKACVNSYGIWWDFVGPNSASGTIAFPASDVISPDVTIVVDYNNGTKLYYALVVYYDPANGYYDYLTYVINNSTGSLSLNFVAGGIYTVNTVPLPHTNAIRIDANFQGDFVLVFEEPDPTLQVIKTWAGNTINTMGPQLSAYGYGDIPNTYLEYMHGDVAVQASDLGSATVYYSYVDVNQSHIVVATINYGDVYDVSFTSATEYTRTNYIPVNDEKLGRPRIAVSGDPSYYENFTVVYNVYDVNADYSHILGLTDHGGTFYEHHYTDNTEGPGTLNLSNKYWHELPCVTYGIDGNGVGKLIEIAWRGRWEDDYLLQAGTSDLFSIIAIRVDAGGFFWDCNLTGDFYSAVTDINILSGSPYDNGSPTLAGKHTPIDSKMNICWQDDVQADVFYKDFDWCSQDFRPGSNHQNKNNDLIIQNNNQPNPILYPNPSQGNVVLNLASLNKSQSYIMLITDVTGRVLKRTIANPQTLKIEAEKTVSYLNAGIYFLNIHDKTKSVFATKVIRL